MPSRRVPVLLLLAVTLSPLLVACGSDDEVRPIPTTDVIDMGEGASESAEPTPTRTVPPGVDPEDVPIDRETRDLLERIALEEVGDGVVEEVERSGDPTHAFEVEVELPREDVTVLISEDFDVVGVDE